MPLSMRRGMVLVSAVAVVCALLTTSATSTQYLVRSLDPKSRDELLRLHQLAKRATAAERDQRWYEVARLAVQHARSIDSPPGEDAPEVVAALKEACPKLPASTLAAVAAWGSHPLVSESYVRALMKGAAPKGIPGPAEAAAEARDALARFGPSRAAASVELVKKVETAAAGGGGAQHSVYKIHVIGEGGPLDSMSMGPRVQRGIRAAIDAAAGAWASRFVVSQSHPPPTEMFFVAELVGWFQNSGTVVVTGRSSDLRISSAWAHGHGFVLADARSPLEVDRTNESDDLAYAGTSLFALATGLEYRELRGDGEYVPPAEQPSFEPLQLRPTAYERGRRLAMVVASRPEIVKVAIASPEQGADEALGRGFGDAMRVLGKETLRLEYAPGRRAYTAEAEQFAASGAQAILFTGAGEESGEWLAALAKRKLRPVVLGTSELSPDGFHANQRAFVEGAILAGDDWEDRDPEMIARLKALGEPALDADFRRGYRFGWIVGRAVVEGAFTPTSLKRVLETRALPQMAGHLGRVLVGVQKGGTNVPVEVVVPLYSVKNGATVALTGF